MKEFFRRIRPYLLGKPLFWVIRLIGSSLKLEIRGWEKYEGVGNAVIAGWHGRSFLALLFFRNKGLYVMTSLSRDGQIQTKIFENFGFQAIRGSSSRGGAKALAESIRTLKKGGVLAMTPDGPRGPAGRIQPGVMMMSKKSGAKLIPTGLASEKRWVLSTWDKYMLPKPFSRAVIIFGDAVVVPPDADDAKLEECRRELERRVHEVQREADGLMGWEPSEPLPDYSDEAAVSSSAGSQGSTLTH